MIKPKRENVFYHYIPYGIKYIHKDMLNQIHSVKNISDFCKICENSDFRILLHSLSKFKERTPWFYEFLDEEDLDNILELTDLANKRITLNEISVGTYDMICRYNIDFLNLIELKIAIDYEK